MARPGDDFDRDILDIIPERFDADADSHQARAGHRLRTGLTLAFAVAAVGIIVAAGLHFVGNKQKAGPGIPVIKADERPLKVRPDDRGGMQVPNQDKLVYERMEGGEGDAKVERLLPAPESPKIPPKGSGPAIELPAARSTEVIRPQAAIPPAAKAPLLTPKPVEQPRPAAEPPAVKAAPPQPVVAQTLPPPLPAPAPSPAPAPAKAASAAPPPPVAAAPKIPSTGDFVIQLGALRAQDLAEKEWGRIQKANHDLLGALKPDIVRVDLEGKGVYWRVRAGPLSEQAARQLCQDLSSRSQGCIVARK